MLNRSNFFISDTILEEVHGGQVIKTLKTWGPEYKISFDVKVNKLPDPAINQLSNLLWFVQTEKSKDYLYPGIFFINNTKTDEVIMLNAIRDKEQKAEVFNMDVKLKEDQWYKIKVELKMDQDESGTLTIAVDGQKVTETKNVPLIEYNNVLWYQSGPKTWYPSVGDVFGGVEVKCMNVKTWHTIKG